MTEILFAEFWKKIEFDTALERVVIAALESKFMPVLIGFGIGYVLAKYKIL
jgi:hypothetical protein